MQYIVIDLEATCWDAPTSLARMEIIEIGAVRLASAAGPVVDEFARFVKPVVERELSPFCRELTSIRQEDVDRAETFVQVFPELRAWIGAAPFTWCSWGAYDLQQLKQDCARHGLPFPVEFERHVNLKKVFAKQRRIKSCGMAAALKIAGLPLSGTHHRGIDDARNIAQLAIGILPAWGREGEPS